MKLRLVMGSILVTSLLTATAAHAESPDDMRRLLQTNECQNCDLSEADLSALDLREANLQGANLSGANLLDAQLTRADLRGADLSYAFLLSTKLTGANLQGADLSNSVSPHLCELGTGLGPLDPCMGTWLRLQFPVELCEETFGAVDGAAPNADGCDPAVLAQAMFEYGYYYQPDSLGYLDLQGANLKQANLTNAELVGADLRYADLSDAIATSADFRYTLLIDANTNNLQDADLSQAWQTRQTLGDWLVTQFQQSRQLANASEAKTYVGSMNRAQQAYYLENNQFSYELEALGIGIASETENYRYGTVQPSAAVAGWSMQYGLSKQDGLTSYIGAAFVTQNEQGELSTQALLCVSEATTRLTENDLPISEMARILPTVERTNIDSPTDPIGCPAGWQIVD